MKTKPYKALGLTLLLVVMVLLPMVSALQIDNQKVDNGWQKELKQDFNIVSSHKLNEKDYGYLKDKNKYELENIYTPEKMFKWCKTYNGVPPNGESLYQVSVRCGDYFDNNIRNLIMSGKNILFIGHDGTIKSLLVYLKLKNNKNIEEFNILNYNAIEINIRNKSLKYLENE